MSPWFTFRLLGSDEVFPYDLMEVTFSDALVCLLFWAVLFNLVDNLCLVTPRWRGGLCRLIIIANFAHLVIVAHLIKRAKEDAIAGTELPNETLLLCFALAYILYDYAKCVNWPDDLRVIQLSVDHLLCALTVTLAMASGSAASVAVAGIAVFHLTNPWAQISWLLSALEYKDNTPSKIVQMTFIKMFFMSRLGYSVFFVYNVCSISDTGLLIKVCTVGLLLISWYHLTLEKQMVPDVHVHESDSDDSDSDSDESDTDGFVNEADIVNIGR